MVMLRRGLFSAEACPRPCIPLVAACQPTCLLQAYSSPKPHVQIGRLTASSAALELQPCGLGCELQQHHLQICQPVAEVGVGLQDLQHSPAARWAWCLYKWDRADYRAGWGRDRAWRRRGTGRGRQQRWGSLHTIPKNFTPCIVLPFPMLGALSPLRQSLHLHIAFLLRYAGSALFVQICLASASIVTRDTGLPLASAVWASYLVEDRGLTARIGAGAITGGSTGVATVGSTGGAAAGTGMAGDEATKTGAGAGEAVGRAGMGLGGGSTGDGGG